MISAFSYQLSAVSARPAVLFQPAGELFFGAFTGSEGEHRLDDIGLARDQVIPLARRNVDDAMKPVRLFP
jgi:hypothetical protein